MSYTHVMGALPPQQYDFANWDFFQSEAIRFHTLTWPERELVIDRIATFRSLMSPRVIAQLGSLVNLHPRFETSEGWDDWLLAVTDALRSHDKTIKDAVTPQGWVEQFKSGRVNARQFWTGLDRLASKGEISSGEQRRLFWDAHSWERQARLVERCPYFDPRDSVWRAEDDAPRYMAEQLLCRIMALSKDEDDFKSKRRIVIGLGVASLGLALLGATLLTMTLVRHPQGDAQAAYILSTMYSLMIAVGLLVPVAILAHRLRELKRSQHESRLHERV